MAQSLHVGLFLDPLLAYLFGICAVYFALKVTNTLRCVEKFLGVYVETNHPPKKTLPNSTWFLFNLACEFSIRKKNMVHIFFSMVPPTKLYDVSPSPLFWFDKHESQTAKHVPGESMRIDIFFIDTKRQGQYSTSTNQTVPSTKKRVVKKKHVKPPINFFFGHLQGLPLHSITNSYGFGRMI